MSFSQQPSDPSHDYARPELRALLDQGIEPLIAWIRNDLAHTHPALGFHATSEWDNHILACYLSHSLPKLPPTGYWQQDVLVVHLPEHWQNACYNRIYTQCSGNCLIPDVFHEFLLRLTRAFGNGFIPARALVYWLDHGKTLDQAVWEEDVAHDQRLLASIARVEKQEGGSIDRSTIHVLQHVGTLEWLGMLTVARGEHGLFRSLHIKGEQITAFGGFHGGEVGRWFDEMRERGYLPHYRHRTMPKPREEPLPHPFPHATRNLLAHLAGEYDPLLIQSFLCQFAEHILWNVIPASGSSIREYQGLSIEEILLILPDMTPNRRAGWLPEEEEL